jgi:hypothetical protein
MPTDLYELPPCRERLAAAGVADGDDDINDARRFRDADGATTPADDTAGVTLPPPEPPAESPWRVISPTGRTPVAEVRNTGDAVRVALVFEKLNRPRPSAGRIDAGLNDATLARARETAAVKHWFAAIAELSRHRRAADLARARLAQLDARRNLLLADGVGDLARQLRDLDAERPRLQAELNDAEELAAVAKGLADTRRAAAAHEVEGLRSSTWCDAVRAAREREGVLRAKVAEQIEGPLSELLEATEAVERLRHQAGERPTVTSSAVAGLMARLEAAAARAAASPRAESQATA